MIDKAVRTALTKFNRRLQKYLGGMEFPVDFGQQEIETIRFVQPYTMTSPERIFSLIQAVEYIVKGEIQGSIVECGVWRGGSMMAVAKTLLRCGCNDREIYLFDTYEGMPAPSNNDVSITGASATEEFSRRRISEDASTWCCATLEDVAGNLSLTGYRREMLRFVKGKVEETIPQGAPERIALLRLDTDWYESTLHELRHLYPRLVPGGVLILDDYGHWQGARKAADEYLAENGISILLNRVDNTGRIAVKPL
jgi:O-methyltransferase